MGNSTRGAYAGVGSIYNSGYDIAVRKAYVKTVIVRVTYKTAEIRVVCAGEANIDIIIRRNAVHIKSARGISGKTAEVHVAFFVGRRIVESRKAAYGKVGHGGVICLGKQAVFKMSVNTAVVAAV